MAEWDSSSVRRAAGITAVIAALGAVGTAGLALLVEVPGDAQRPDSMGARATLDVRPLAEATRGPGDVPPSMPDSARALRESLAARTRLKPDRRALLALQELQRLVDGAAQPVDARWVDDRWQLTLGGAPAGALSDHADFDELFATLTESARGLTALHPLERAPSPLEPWAALSPSSPALPRLVALDAAWSSGARSVDVLRGAAQALAALAVETPDTLGAGDLLAARAMAALAWTEALGAGDPECVALLAAHMGYRSAALRRVESMRDTSPVRLWVRRDDHHLRQAANAPEASETVRYLWFRRLVERAEHDEALAWVSRRMRGAEGHLSLEAWLPEAARETPRETAQTVTVNAPSRAVNALGREVPTGAAIARAALDPFAQAAALTAARTHTGVFLDGALFAARDRAAVGSAVLGHIALDLDARGTDDLTRLTNTLNASPPDAYRDLALWATHLARVRAGTLGADALLQDLAATASPGAFALRLTADDALAPIAPHDPDARLVIELLAAHLDARPAHRAHLAKRAGDVLHDLPLVLSLCESYLRDDARGDDAPWCLARRGDTDALVELAGAQTVSIGLRVRALTAADEVIHAPPGALDDAWRSLVSDAPRAWTVLGAFSRWLLAHDRADEAVSLARAWRTARRDATPSELADARTVEARALRARGETQAALQALEPALAGAAPGPLTEAALGLADLGRFDDAERAASAAVDRAHDPDSLAVLAEVLWRRNTWTRAARALARTDVTLRPQDWRAPIATTFARVFVHAQPDAAREAMGELVAAGLPPTMLRELPRALHAQGRDDLAALTLDALLPRRDGDIDALIEAYTYRRTADAAAALTWARAHDLDRARDLAPVAHARGADELLWAFTAPASPAAIERLWAFRTAASLRAGDRDPHRADVMRHLAQSTGEASLPAQLLVDRASLSAVVATARTPARRTSVAYFAGLAAHAKGRLDEAFDWYTLAAWGDPRETPEAALARSERDALYGRAQPFERLAVAPWGTTSEARADTAPETLDAAPESPADAPAPTRADRPARRGHNAHRGGHHGSHSHRARHGHHGR